MLGAMFLFNFDIGLKLSNEILTAVFDHVFGVFCGKSVTTYMLEFVLDLRKPYFN